MKLAEALQERADLNKKISDLQGRFDDADANGWKPEQYIFTENFESLWSTGGFP